MPKEAIQFFWQCLYTLIKLFQIAVLFFQYSLIHESQIWPRYVDIAFLIPSLSMNITLSSLLSVVLLKSLCKHTTVG